MIILIGGEKGGSGKTTIATNLAAMRTKKSHDLLLIDTDKQSTADYWCSLREDKNIQPRVASVQKFNQAVRTESLELSTKYKDLIIDAGGRDSSELRNSLWVADKAIFPIRPSQFDVWTLTSMNLLVGIAREANTNLQAFVVINQASTNPGVKEVEEAEKFIHDFPNLKLLKTTLCERIIYRRAASMGMGVTEYHPEDIKATKEMSSLYEEIFNERF